MRLSRMFGKTLRQPPADLIYEETLPDWGGLAVLLIVSLMAL